MTDTITKVSHAIIIGGAADQVLAESLALIASRADITTAELEHVITIAGQLKSVLLWLRVMIAATRRTGYEWESPAVASELCAACVGLTAQLAEWRDGQVRA